MISRDHRVDGWVKWVMWINYMVMEHRRLKTMKFFFLHDTVIIDNMLLYIYQKPIECTTQKVNFNINYGFQ